MAGLIGKRPPLDGRGQCDHQRESVAAQFTARGLPVDIGSRERARGFAFVPFNEELRVYFLCVAASQGESSDRKVTKPISENPVMMSHGEPPAEGVNSPSSKPFFAADVIFSGAQIPTTGRESELIDFFLLFINHKGRFVTVDRYEAYYGDCVATVTGLDADRLGYFDIEDEIEKLGYENWGRICYKHRRTREFKDITDDAGVMDCLGQMQGNKRYVEIYVQTEQEKKPSGVAVCQQENKSRNRVSKVAEDFIPTIALASCALGKARYEYKNSLAKEVDQDSRVFVTGNGIIT
ncbi:glycine--tRNA ligase beta subunit [Striga asiatica]|uniref:Glycine--tRNA ligase beta subunit n=1 Tax=Striga asiatica TaxID=4170 RepID=A0A5A7P974_STRAF|nr:glycine--tRNA ligase beta subunit [Striga asiatica]